MFRVKTVFVIGAGASAELGFPIGTGLKDQIRSAIDFEISDFGRLERGDQMIWRAMLADGRSADLVLDAARRLRDALAVSPSIDNCLHVHRNDEAAVRCGKLAIARRILAAEAGSPLRKRRAGGLDLTNPGLRETYLPALATLLTTDIQDLGPEIFANVSFVIFNYDRCVQEMLFNALRALYGGSDRDVAHVISRANFVHPYGSLGPLPWQSRGRPVEFGQELDESELDRVAKNIRTFTEGVDDEQRLASLRAAYDHAEQVVFLGFGFLNQNMELLTNRSTEPVAYRRRGFVTGYGIDDLEREHIENLITRSLPAHRHALESRFTVVREAKCAELLARLSRTLTAR